MGILIDDVSGTTLAAVILVSVMKEGEIIEVHFASGTCTSMGLGNVTPPTALLRNMIGRIGEDFSLIRYVRPQAFLCCCCSLHR